MNKNAGGRMIQSVKKLIVFCVLFVLAAASFAGCAKESRQNGAASSEQKIEYIMPRNIGTGHKLIFVCPQINNYYWQKCIEGIRRADAEVGTETKILGSESEVYDPAELAENLDKAIQENPDGILVYAGTEKAEPGLKKAVQAGIPVVTIDADSPSGNRLAYVGTDLYELGNTAAQAMMQIVDPGDEVGYICSTFESTNEAAVLEAFREVVTEYDLTITAEEEGYNNADRAGTAAERMLREHPEIKAVFCTGGENVTGAGRYIKEKGLDVKLVGFEDTDENISLLREGVINALIAQNPEEMGYVGVYVLRDYLETGSLYKTDFNTDAILLTKNTLDDYLEGDFSPNLYLKRVKIGYYEGDSQFQSGFSDDVRKSGYAYEYYQAISTLCGWRYEYEYGTRQEMIEKLKLGEVDIVAGVYKSENNEERFYLSSMDMGLPSPERYFAVNHSRVDLFSELENAMRELKQDKPYFESDLYTKYYGQKNKNSVLTKSEQAFLQTLKELRVGYVRSNLPLSDQDNAGNPTGLVKDLMQYIADYTLLPVKPVCFDTIEEMDTALKDMKIEVAFPSFSDIWLNEKSGFKQTDPFLSDRVMLIYSGTYSDEIFNQVAVNSTGIGQEYYLSTNYPHSKLVRYKTRDESFDAIKKGKERCTVGCSSVLQLYLFEHPEYKDLNVAYLNATVNLGMCVNEWNSYLISILNKVITNMGSAAINSALLSYTGIEKSVSFGEIVQRYSVFIILILGGFTAAIVIIFIHYQRKTKAFLKKEQETNLALEEALEKANEASEAKTRFLSSMSHDIRTPMNAIVGMSSIAEKYPDDKERVRDCLSKITISGQHLLTLINDILDISKIESGKLTLNPTRFSLQETVRDLLNIVGTSVKDKGLELRADIDEIPHDTIVADQVRVNQVFINLLSNAIKYTPSGGCVTVRLRETADEEKQMAHVTYVVEDTGVGMSEEFMRTMYESFTREQDTRVNKIQGAGLGLAIVKQMVELMGGTIDCRSKEGVGTTFTVEMDVPFVHKENRKEESADPMEALAGLHVLVAEDNELNWEVISELLSFFEVTSERAENGQICLDKLHAAEAGTYDLVLMDIQMPVMNGRQAAREIRKDEREDIRTIPVIALSADSFAEDIAECMAAGMNGHVSKPVDMNKLAQEVQRVLKELGRKRKD
ncbi:MAG: substrate-binding domain-containing protein [Eubacterium sp.]|nr:substrate-binding domain-containing protein [Eubacterium sp.]